MWLRGHFIFDLEADTCQKNRIQSSYPGNAGKNPLGIDGNPISFLGCGSYEHFIRDCNSCNRVKVFALLSGIVGSEIDEITISWILEALQEITADIWQVCNSREDNPTVEQCIE